MLQPSELKKFPTTRYQGSKRKILSWLYENLRDLDFHTVLDGCGGTGSVSYLLKKMGKSVTYNDNLKFNYLIGKAIIENQDVTLTEDDIQFILNIGEPALNFITKNFQDFYYTENENRWLDGIVGRITELNGYDERVLEYKKALCYYALFQASLRKRPFNLFHRKNLYIRTNDVKRNFGNKTTWERDFASEFEFFSAEANRVIFNSEIECFALNESVFDIDNVNYDLVYLDPPYISESGTNESSDYLRCYHFLEGLSDYGDWEEKIDFNSINLRFRNEHNKNRFDRTHIYDSLNTLFEKFQNSIIVLSYKIGGIPSVEELETLMGQYKNEVRIESLHYKYALNRQNGNAQYNREVLIIGI